MAATKFEADIRLVVRVPFTADGETEEDRILAAEHAETELAGQLRKAVGKKGEIVSVLVEEVRER